MDPIVSTIVFSGSGLLISLFVLYKLLFRTPNDPRPSKAIGYLMGLSVALMICGLSTGSAIDDRKPIQYPIVDRQDINGQYEYVDTWENPETKCRYLIHRTRVSSGRLEINRLPNGKEDCPANR